LIKIWSGALPKKIIWVIICGRYEGIDERLRCALVTDEISIGDYVLTGGELPAMVLVDAVTRFVPGVLSEDALISESFTSDILDYPQYTRPREFRGMAVPDVLVSGDHEKVRLWRRKQHWPGHWKCGLTCLSRLL